MNCKDLMIGDWVYIHEPECKGYRIDAIDELDGQVGADGEVYDECDIRPIPLTEYILVKNGFELENKIEDDCLTYRYGNFHLFYYPDGTGLYNYNSQIVFGSVHQLQQLLRLCGIDKELIID